MTIDRRHRRRRVQSRAAGHADGGDHQDAGRAGEPADAAAIVQDQPAPRKPMPCTMFEATRPLSGLASPASTAESSVKKALPMQMSRLVRTPAALRLTSRSRPTSAAQQAGHQQAADGAVHHHHLLQPVEVEGLRELCQGHAHRASLPDAITAQAGLVEASAWSIGDVKRAGGWPGAVKWPHGGQALGMRLHGPVDLVAVEGQHEGRMCGGRGQRVAIDLTNRSR